MQILKVWMCQAFLHCISLIRIEHQHPREQIETHRIGLWEQRLEMLLAALRQRSDVLQSVVISDISQIVAFWSAQNRDDPLDLIEIVLTWEQWRSTQELSIDAPDWPNVKCFGVL